MKKLAQVSLITISLSFVQAHAEEKLDLEPCINGAVSSFGEYPTQAQEDLALQEQSEPCIYGELATSSLYAEKVAQNVSRHQHLTRQSEVQLTSMHH